MQENELRQGALTRYKPIQSCSTRRARAGGSGAGGEPAQNTIDSLARRLAGTCRLIDCVVLSGQSCGTHLHYNKVDQGSARLAPNLGRAMVRKYSA